MSDVAEKQQDAEDRTDKYGGDDGALENERALIAPGEDPGPSRWQRKRRRSRARPRRSAIRTKT